MYRICSLIISKSKENIEYCGLELQTEKFSNSEEYHKVMYRSIRNSHNPPCPGRGYFDGPQRTWGGAFDHNNRGVGNLIRCLDFMFRAALRIKTARVCLQTLKQLPDPPVIIVEPIFNLADTMFLFVSPNNIRLSAEERAGGGAFDH